MHDVVAKSFLANWISADSVKGVLVSGVFATALWVGHLYVSSKETPMQQTLDAHTQQLTELTKSVKDTAVAVQQLSVGQVSIEGKIDTLGAKIDDDRRQNKDAANAAHTAAIAAVAASANNSRK